MPGDDFLRAQLRQAQDALATAERLRQAAEAEYRAAADKLCEIARTLLPTEWNALRREHPDATSWPPSRLGDWIIETGRRKLNRLELLTAGGDLAAEVETLTAERDQLRAQLRQAQDELAALRADHSTLREQVAARDAELARLRDEVVRLREAPREPLPTATTPGPAADWLAEWQAASDDFEHDKAALRAIGVRGFCLRLDIARTIGFRDASSGAARRVFESLREHGLIEENRPKVEGVGRTPYLLRLTERGREAFRALFGEEPVESEYDRLLARHKSPEHVLLNLQARDVLLAAGAESVDLYPRPVPLPNGGTFDVDIVAVFDGKPLYVEAERAVRGGKGDRTHKWNNYATVTRDFYVVVPNKRSKTVVVSEISRWAYENPERAAGVTLHLCQLSGFDGKTLWQVVRRLGRRERRG